MPAKDLLTPEERRILALYRSGNSAMRRATRLTMQYLLGAVVFVAIAVTTGQAWWSLVTLATFAAYALMRLVRGRQLGNVIPNVIAKYERRIEELESRIAGSAG